MKKKIKTIFLFSFFVMLLYTITWFSILTLSTLSFNKLYAKRDININLLKTNEFNYKVRFSKISPYGFPFKIAFSIFNFVEEANNSILEFLVPINFGYDLITQSFFLDFSGKVMGYYKPIELGFGLIFDFKKYSIIVKAPFNLKKVKLFLKKGNPFEIINFITEFYIQSGKSVILDLKDQKKIYEEEYSKTSVSFEHQNYYYDLEELKNNIPKIMYFEYNAKINESQFLKRKMPAGLFLHRIIWPIKLTLNTKCKIQTKSSILNEIFQDFEIRCVNFPYNKSNVKTPTEFFFKNKSLGYKNTDFNLKINSQIHLSKDFDKNALDFIDYVLHNVSNKKLNLSISRNLYYIINNKEKFNLEIFKGRDFFFKIDINFIIRPNNMIKLDFNELHIFSKETGFYLTSNILLNGIKDFNVNGTILINNYTKPVEIAMRYILNLEKFSSFSEKKKNIHIESSKKFLKFISEHPDSISRDINFDFKINSKDLEKSKIGSINYYKIIPLYKLFLYEEGVKYTENDDNQIKELLKTLPDF